MLNNTVPDTDLLDGIQQLYMGRCLVPDRGLGKVPDRNWWSIHVTRQVMQIICSMIWSGSLYLIPEDTL